MPRRHLGTSVLDEAVARMQEVYEEGHRVMVSFSGGKDSGVALEVCILAATLTDRLPVEVVMRDEEIMLPGTFEYCHRVAERPEVDFHWMYANQPVVNVYNREQPYFWVFDPLLDPSEWVREPPEFAYRIPEQHIGALSDVKRFPPPEGKRLVAVLGLRVSESVNRLRGLFSSGGYMTKGPGDFGAYYARPVYDWNDGDVWKAHAEYKWDYNRAYDTMVRFGHKRRQLRIAPPTINALGARELKMASQAWPKWFERVARRLPGVRLAAKYGLRALMPPRRYNETWEQAFNRLCIEEAPEWIADRARRYKKLVINQHRAHSTEPVPQVTQCKRCGQNSSWYRMVVNMYDGDPFCSKTGSTGELQYVEPEFFRPGAGTWGGKPSF